MRLIDADKLVKAIENENPGMSISGAIEKFARTAQVNMQPTVDAIPIELYKQVKGERDVAIEQLKARNIELFEKPYLRAIPIEWIEKYIEDHTQYMVTPKYEDTHFDEPPIDYYTKLWPFQVAKMLERWEGENETDRC